MSERHCLKCVHCVVDMGTPDYSEVTPGDPAEITCRKGKWAIDELRYGVRQQLCANMETAKNCGEYEEEP